MSFAGDIIHLNVGGRKFSTSRQTLGWISDSFFSSLLSGRISSLKDESGAIFIDRDPDLFGKILNYLRTRELDLRGVDIHSLRHEAEFYAITPLVRRLTVCQDLERPSCGGLLFHGSIPAPALPAGHESIVDEHAKRLSYTDDDIVWSSVGNADGLVRNSNSGRILGHKSDRSVADTRQLMALGGASGCSHVLANCRGSHFNGLQVTVIRGHFNWIAVAFSHFVCLYRMKEALGWILAWTSAYIEPVIEQIALNAKAISANQENCNRMVAASYGSSVRLWSVNDNGRTTREVGLFALSVGVDSLFFIGSQLVALSRHGKIGVWHSASQNWQVQDVEKVSSYDTAGSLLLLGCHNGSIYCVDMQKFPLRMKDNDLLVTELYKDVTGDRVTALSVYLTPKTNVNGNWIEIVYGTASGVVCVIVQHPETLGQGPQLFQTFHVHRTPVTRVMLSEKYLISVCAEYNHVRSWSITRFRGYLSTQPGSVPLASFKVVALDELDPVGSYATGNDIGPFGEKDDQQVFVQKVVPDSTTLFVRLSSSGKRVCTINSVDGSSITAFVVHECEGSSRMGSRSRRYIFTGHSNGTIQIWDLSTALELMNQGKEANTDDGGPVAAELVHVLDHCDLTNSRLTTPSISPASSSLLVAQGTVPTSQQQPQQQQTPVPRRLHTVALASTSAQGISPLVTVSLPVTLSDTSTTPTSPRTSK